MSLLALVAAAHATAWTSCDVELLRDAPGTRIEVGCTASSAAPGGPVSSGPMPVSDVAVVVLLRGVEVARLERLETRGDAAIYGADVELVPGLAYEVVGGDPIDRHAIVAGPDLRPLHRCQTNPDTCLRSLGEVPGHLAPAMRLQACIGGAKCALEGAIDEASRRSLEQACASWRGPACGVLADLEPDVAWDSVGAKPPGRGRLAATAVRYVVEPPGEPVGIGWTDEVPAKPRIAAGLDDTLAAAGELGREVRWAEDRVTLLEGGRRVWEWRIAGVDGVALRPDGEQLLVRSGRLVAWVAFDGAEMPPFQGFPVPPHGRGGSGRVIDAEGWPVAGVRVSAPCDADDAAFACVAVTDLLGGYPLAGTEGSIVRVEDLRGVTHTLGVLEALPVRIPASDRVFDFDVDHGGRVVRASAPLQEGDVVVGIGPLRLDDREGHAFHVPREAAAGLATSWGSVDVLRDGRRLTLE
ncbi:MAG: hypothetical protein H6737_16240 [Alphaproteobacteria bacterium]|nr:hypothetical protein [Alphaproteobacteria bacterium]